MTRPDTYLSYADQAMLLTLRGAGHEAVVQVLWLYDQSVDAEVLQRLNHRLGRTLLGRRIETSPLPFGRHRWVAAATAPFDLAEASIERTALYDWADRQVDLPLDPEIGPAWRLSATPMADGGAVVSLVVSHCIADGAAAQSAIAAAITGETEHRRFPQPESRQAPAAAISDLRRLGSDLPDISRALLAAARALRRDRRSRTPRPALEPPQVESPGTVHLPTASLVTDLAAWDARATELGGNRFALAVALAARLGRAVGREREGGVMMLVPVSERADSDLDGNLVALAHIRVPTPGPDSDLTDIRSAVRTGITDARSEPDAMVSLLPLVPFVPRRAIGSLTNRAFGFGSDLPVSVSNMGVLPDSIRYADGTPAEVLLFRGVDRNVSTASLVRRNGVLSVFSGAIDDQWTLTTSGWQAETLTRSAELRAALARAAADLGVVGAIL